MNLLIYRQSEKCRLLQKHLKGNTNLIQMNLIIRDVNITSKTYQIKAEHTDKHDSNTGCGMKAASLEQASSFFASPHSPPPSLCWTSLSPEPNQRETISPNISTLCHAAVLDWKLKHIDPCNTPLECRASPCIRKRASIKHTQASHSYITKLTNINNKFHNARYTVCEIFLRCSQRKNKACNNQNTDP